VEDVIEEADQEKEDNVEGLDAAALSNSPPGEYGTVIPDLARIARESTSSRRNEPPQLPPHLNQVLLNSSSEPRNDDPNVLPVPNHVVLNHLYACSIKDNVMAVSSTSRYRGKYMTTIYYKPVAMLG
ncbi:5'-AMP-activated protein kinase subunit beta-2, partial [Coemansia spiralis]